MPKLEAALRLSQERMLILDKCKSSGGHGVGRLTVMWDISAPWFLTPALLGELLAGNVPRGASKYEYGYVGSLVTVC